MHNHAVADDGVSAFERERLVHPFIVCRAGSVCFEIAEVARMMRRRIRGAMLRHNFHTTTDLREGHRTGSVAAFGRREHRHRFRHVRLGGNHRQYHHRRHHENASFHHVASCSLLSDYCEPSTHCVGTQINRPLPKMVLPGVLAHKS